MITTGDIAIGKEPIIKTTRRVKTSDDGTVAYQHRDYIKLELPDGSVKKFDSIGELMKYLQSENNGGQQKMIKVKTKEGLKEFSNEDFKGLVEEGNEVILEAGNKIFYNKGSYTVDGNEIDNFEGVVEYLAKDNNNEVPQASWHGVKPDAWHDDGTPIFKVDKEDYVHGVSHEPDQTWKFHDERLKNAIKNSGYKKISCWLVDQENDGKKYKFIKPGRPKPKD